MARHGVAVFRSCPGLLWIRHRENGLEHRAGLGVSRHLGKEDSGELWHMNFEKQILNAKHQGSTRQMEVLPLHVMTLMETLICCVNHG